MKKAAMMILLGWGLVTTFSWMGYAQGDTYAEGKTLFENKCQICHGSNGRGDGPAAPALNPRPTDFMDPKFWQGDVDRKITETIRKGHPPMRAFNIS